MQMNHGGGSVQQRLSQQLSQQLVGRMAAVLFVGGGAGTFSSALLPAEPHMQPAGIMGVGSSAVLIGVAVWFLPWERWSQKASLWLVPVAFGLIALGNFFAGSEPFRYAVFFIVAFTWIGFGHPRGTSLAFAPLFVVAYLAPLVMTDSATASALASLIIVGPICLAVGESMAWVSARLRVTEMDLHRMQSERYFRSLIQNSSDIVMILDDAGLIRYESPSIQHVLGYEPVSRIGRSPLDLVHPDDTPAAQQALGQVLRSVGAEQRLEFRVRHADGSWHVVEAISKNLLAAEHVNGVVVNYRDVTERKALEEQLKHQAFHDSLTGLANRALFTDRVEHALARLGRGPTSLAVLFVDLDDFKTVNDSLGHAAGDELLVAVSRRLQAGLRPADTAARLGGDEFGVLLEDVELMTAKEIASRLLEGLRPPFRFRGEDLSVQASIGIAIRQGRNQSGSELLRNADVAMYSAKERGKGRYEVFESGMQQAAVRRLQLKADLERALERGQFTLRYQPLVVLGTGEIRGVEALVRWEHPVRGMVMPAEFIGLAEESELILHLGRWVLNEACGQARAWGDDFPRRRALTMSVNLSVRQLQDPGLIDDVAACLARTGLDARLLTLEITESVLMHDTEFTMDMLRRLKALGVRIAIDDFGTGYSSLSYLRQFPIDSLKIDRSFVASIVKGGEESALVRSIISLSRAMHLETVAEGIEHPIQAAELEALGSDLAQGYYFARPLRAEDIGPLLRQPAMQWPTSTREPASLGNRRAS
jgi:diguanylate cyclase (GGDEF)-like protein/PAS domain S-box-containing protein